MTQEQSPQTDFGGGASARSQIGFVLHVHLDDGTTLDYPCVATVTPASKESKEDHYSP